MTEQEDKYVICHYCGRIIHNDAAENADFGKVPYPDDQGLGACKDCAGDPDDSSFKKRLGWAGRIFYDARIEVLKDQLKADQLAKFEAMSYERKVALIGRLIQKGAMI